eukprot:TRINITY_DN18458_c0_g1_i2.p1 TRINITY_DN18458_c0_g1~~TRINITY_DN18458_c0_g1_i2.p1  ORF type:complete len:219 (-),score=43.53 TRINITY_DN18458_c0_g1_i2:54-710(-)
MQQGVGIFGFCSRIGATAMVNGGGGGLLVLVACVMLQFAYQQYYPWLAATWAQKWPEVKVNLDAVFGGVGDERPNVMSQGANVESSAASDRINTAEAVEVKEFLGARCEGPAARVWHIPPAPVGTCLNLRPRMTKPGEGGRTQAQSVAQETLFGRVSCSEMRREGGGFVEICSSASCDPASCFRVGVVKEGSCGTSFTGFAAATWRCVPAAVASAASP